MLNVIFMAILSTLLAGLLVKYLLEWFSWRDAYGTPYVITWREFLFGILMITLVFAPTSAFIGWKICEGNNLSFNEFWNGWEEEALIQTVNCTRDGPCRWEYSCDPYTVYYECGSTDSKGNYHSRTCSRIEYHDCPYVTNEYHYISRTTLGDFTIGAYRFPLNPDGQRWRSGKRVPAETIQRAGVGEPPFWTTVKNRCRADEPGPVTVRTEYDNYILASEQTILQEYSSDIGDYLERGVMPKLNTSIERFYRSRQVYFVGMRARDPSEWNVALEYFNAQLGVELQGDIHLVVVQDEQINRIPDRYTIALKAHWLDKSVYEDDTLAKNDIGLVVGTTDGKTVAWSRAFTGMPMGNEKLIVMLRDGLKGIPLAPGNIIGPGYSERLRNRSFPTQVPNAGSPTKLRNIVWGLDDPSTRFTRLPMTGEDGNAGYLYLKNEIRLTSSQAWTVFLVTCLICMVVWVFWAIYELPEHHAGKRRSRFY